MKLIIAALMLVTSFAFADETDLADGAIAQAAPADPVVQPTPAQDATKDVKGTIVEPTHEQKKHVNDAAKKAKKKKKDKKIKAKAKTKAAIKAKSKAKAKTKQKAAKKTSDT